MLRKFTHLPARLRRELDPLSALWRAASRRSGPLRVHYGPAQGGVGGGPSKRALLEAAFPHHERGFNLMYAIQLQVDPRFARLAKQRGAALVQSLDGVNYPAYHPARWRAVNDTLGRLYTQADYVIFQSAFARRSAEHFLGAPPAQFKVLLNAVDTDHFSPGPAFSNAARPRDPAAPLLLAMGAHRFFYRLEIPVRALALLRRDLPGARLHIAGKLGTGEGQRAVDGRIQQLVAELGLQDAVTFGGIYSYADAPALYRRADLLLHIQYGDVCPNVVLEALACGLPVVAQASGGLPELVSEAEGVLIPAGWDWERLIIPTPQEVAEAVRAALARRASLAAAARQRAVDRFSLDKWLEKHRMIFTTFVK